MRAARIITAAVLLASAATPAGAHRLKLFATLENETISGYAFFVGGGRAHGAELTIADASGQEVARLATDDAGAFTWKAPAPNAYRLSASTGDGHVAEASIDRARFGSAQAEAESAEDAAPAQGAVTQAQIERTVEAAVARQMRPLLEAYQAAEGRTRFNDIMGGVGMIVGLAGIALWASSRRRGIKP